MEDSDRRLRADPVLDGDDKERGCRLAHQEAVDAALIGSRLEVERRRRKSEESAPSTDDAKIRARTKLRERIKAARLSGH